MAEQEQGSGWTGKVKSGAKSAGASAWKYSYKISDKLAIYANKAAHKVGSEAFWPAANDTPQEIEKCARILTTFTFRGVEETIQKEAIDPKTGKKYQKQQKVLKKIPPAVIRQAKGLAIYTSFRTGFAPLSGAGGAGLIIARLPDGSWSAPASFMPQNLSAGFMIGIDIYDVVLVIRSEKALQSFYGHKFSLGAEIGVTAGPVGAGAMLETGKELAPVWSYVKSKGFYAGLEVNGTILISRTDEMARFYQWEGIKAEDVLTGKARVPYEAKVLHKAIRDAEDLPDDLDADEVLGVPIPEELELDENETLHLPPTPAQLASFETMSFKESWEAQERAERDAEDEAIYNRPPPVRADRKAPQLPPRVMSSASVKSEGDSSLYSESSTALQIPPVDDSSSDLKIPPVDGSPDDEQEVFSDAIGNSSEKPAIPPRRRPVPPTPPPYTAGDNESASAPTRDSKDIQDVQDVKDEKDKGDADLL